MDEATESDPVHRYSTGAWASFSRCTFGSLTIIYGELLISIVKTLCIRLNTHPLQTERSARQGLQLFRNQYHCLAVKGRTAGQSSCIGSSAVDFVHITYSNTHQTATRRRPDGVNTKCLRMSVATSKWTIFRPSSLGKANGILGSQLYHGDVRHLTTSMYLLYTLAVVNIHSISATNAPV